ncbi:MAG: hypothetical protein ACKOPM_00220 [Novosphingobium sp.]
MAEAPAAPLARLSIGVTGHRRAHPAMAGNEAQVRQRIEALLDAIAAHAAAEARTLGAIGPVRLLTLLADGIDQIAAGSAVARGWDLVVPLPFGRTLNQVINAHPASLADAEALLAGSAPPDPACAANAAAIAAWYEKARLFELADHDDLLTGQLLASLADPHDKALAALLSANTSANAAIAGRVMVEQSDFLVAVWDGRSSTLAGGTGHTIATALDRGCPVVRIDPAAPDAWHILHAPESLAAMAPSEDRDAALAELVRTALRPGEGGALKAGAEALAAEEWHARSSPLWTAYRRIEALFGGDPRPLRSLISTYEPPEAVATGSGAPVLAGIRALPGGDLTLSSRVEHEVMRPAAWSDGISSRLSDAYRGGMTTSFILSALAIVCGISYEPFASIDRKWIFASGEFLLLAAILVIIWRGSKERWHKRWFETRRVAEYLRHGPISLALGVARPPARWPRGNDTGWPEYYARHALRAIGLPQVKVTKDYLRVAASRLLDAHVTAQRDYHIAKAKRLRTVHHRLDGLSGRLFQLAILSVSTYLATAALSHFGLVSENALHDVAKYASYLGVIFPTFGAALAGIRYFGDFERFSAISEVTAAKLDAVHQRLVLLLSAPDHALSYAQVSELAHAADDIVVSEIENWQAVFGGKHITVPV